MRRSRERAICVRQWVETYGGKPVETRAEVRVMARAEGYAMVRRKDGMPFVVAETELRPLPAAQETAR